MQPLRAYSELQSGHLFFILDLILSSWDQQGNEVDTHSTDILTSLRDDMGVSGPNTRLSTTLRTVTAPAEDNPKCCLCSTGLQEDDQWFVGAQGRPARPPALAAAAPAEFLTRRLRAQASPGRRCSRGSHRPSHCPRGHAPAHTTSYASAGHTQPRIHLPSKASFRKYQSFHPSALLVLIHFQAGRPPAIRPPLSSTSAPLTRTSKTFFFFFLITRCPVRADIQPATPGAAGLRAPLS